MRVKSFSHTCKNFDKNLVNFDMSIIVLVAAGRLASGHSGGEARITSSVHICNAEKRISA